MSNGKRLKRSQSSEFQENLNGLLLQQMNDEETEDLLNHENQAIHYPSSTKVVVTSTTGPKKLGAAASAGLRSSSTNHSNNNSDDNENGDDDENDEDDDNRNNKDDDDDEDDAAEENINKPLSKKHNSRKRQPPVDRVRGNWSEEEDNKMKKAIELCGQNWRAVAAMVHGRTAKQCRDRYRLKLDPSINHGPWTAAEDELLLRLHDEVGRQWTKIAMSIPGRTENSVKTRFASIQRSKVREWTPEEDVELRRLRDLGIGFDVISKNHMPRRSEHSLKKRWERLFMRDLAKKIREDLPNSIASSSSITNPPLLIPPSSVVIPAVSVPATFLNPVNASPFSNTLVENGSTIPTPSFPIIPSNNGLADLVASKDQPLSSSTFLPDVSKLVSSPQSNSEVFRAPSITRKQQAQHQNDQHPLFTEFALGQVLPPSQTGTGVIGNNNNNNNNNQGRGRTRLQKHSESMTVLMNIIGDPVGGNDGT